MKKLIDKIANVDFEITYLCNLKCLHCYNPHHKKLEELSLEQIKEIIKHIKDVGFTEIHINGGEPLLRDDAYDILEFASNLGLRVLLETNATLLKNIGKLKILPNFAIRASIDGPENEHNIIRRNTSDQNSFTTALTNLSEAKKAGIDVQLTCSVNKINYTKIYDMIKQVAIYGIDDVRLRLSMPTNSAEYHWNILKLSRQQFLEIDAQIKMIAEDFPDIKFDSGSINRKNPSTEPKFFIDPYGNVKPYPFIEYYVGNLKNETVQEILIKIQKVQLPKEDEKKMVEYLDELNVVL